MSLSNTFFLAAGSLFDFDLTFVIELGFFVILSLVVTSRFIRPISQEIDARSQFTNCLSLQSIFFIHFASKYEELRIKLMRIRMIESRRQSTNLIHYTNSKFDTEVTNIIQQNSKFLMNTTRSHLLMSYYMLGRLNNTLSYIALDYLEDTLS